MDFGKLRKSQGLKEKARVELKVEQFGIKPKEW